MTKMKSTLKKIFLFILITNYINGQKFISKEEALELVLENNFGIKVSKNTTEIVKNNSSILNSGYLPSLSISSGGNYTGSDTEIAFPGQFDDQGNPIPNRVFEDQETQRFNAGLNLNYTLFDGLGRRYTYKRLKEEYALSELQLRETIEFTTLQLLRSILILPSLLNHKKFLKKL